MLSSFSFYSFCCTNNRHLLAFQIYKRDYMIGCAFSLYITPFHADVSLLVQNIQQFQRAHRSPEAHAWALKGLFLPTLHDLIGSFSILLDVFNTVRINFRVVTGLSDHLVILCILWKWIPKEFKQLSQSYTTVFAPQTLSKNSGHWIPCSIFFPLDFQLLHLPYFIPSLLKIATNATKQTNASVAKSAKLLCSIYILISSCLYIIASPKLRKYLFNWYEPTILPSTVNDTEEKILSP